MSSLTETSSLSERIIIAVDNTEEMAELFTKTRTKLQVVIQALKMFVSLKSSSSSHQSAEFALVLLSPEGSQWMFDFTSDTAFVLSAIDALTVAFGEQGGVLDMSTLLQLVQEHFPQRSTTPTISYCRVLLVFGRSNDVPIYSMGRGAHAELLQHPGFGFDVMYLHQKPNETNHVREVFDALGRTDVQNVEGNCPNFLFARHHKAQLVMRDTSMLLQHPGLRKLQPKNFDEMKDMLRFPITANVPVPSSSSSSFISHEVQEVQVVQSEEVVESAEVVQAEVVQSEFSTHDCM
jgi:hypothetical protein